MRTLFLFLLCTLFISQTSGCVGAVIGATTDAVIEVAKVPFKVGGAVIDVATGDDDDDNDDEQ